jgi:hypothetical protein
MKKIILLSLLMLSVIVTQAAADINPKPIFGCMWIETSPGSGTWREWCEVGTDYWLPSGNCSCSSDGSQHFHCLDDGFIGMIDPVDKIKSIELNPDGIILLSSNSSLEYQLKAVDYCGDWHCEDGRDYCERICITENGYEVQRRDRTLDPGLIAFKN